MFGIADNNNHIICFSEHVSFLYAAGVGILLRERFLLLVETFAFLLEEATAFITTRDDTLHHRSVGGIYALSDSLTAGGDRCSTHPSLIS